ncbi:protein-L-isoaspartate(D-aspartate) O-methyltransferase [Allofranklinella schreckenbergeri]|uniref:Protein-L-isoaspartate O-methyltransferase n=1 Tax=Allofranklinella schreckenbergeri TaxID=1076744 RepID=A0A3M6R4B8_9BURK|nr:protein-L-isoaspartate(D-aspartate) O-methyltransferase [Allofranklinella schreckenbergeri]MDO4704882.1 protein-L-isoaspartate(D-aspartate) O-methyltransferase [Comamonadaceae bacterium]RMX09995.1 protein-L-isoaspartate(D-aspartate) O-methyltransferase [Allofranklinella schreckenbergeri]
MNTPRKPRFPAQVLPSQTGRRGLGSAGAVPRPPLGPSAPLVSPGAQPANAPAAPIPAPIAAYPSSERPPATAPAASWGLPVDPPGQESARIRMVKRLAALPHLHPAVLHAMQTVPRHAFIDSALMTKAYEDNSLPIGFGQTISKPSVVARMLSLALQAPCVPPGASHIPMRVLEIGTGCGYQAAVMSHIASEVYSIERVRGLHERARSHLRPLRVSNLHLLFGDGMAGYAAGAPYAAIVSAAGGDAIPQAWVDQLAIGGRIIAPTSNASGAQQLLVIDKTATGVRQHALEAVHFVPLKSGVG